MRQGKVSISYRCPLASGSPSCTKYLEVLRRCESARHLTDFRWLNSTGQTTESCRFKGQHGQYYIPCPTTRHKEPPLAPWQGKGRKEASAQEQVTVKWGRVWWGMDAELGRGMYSTRIWARTRDPARPQRDLWCCFWGRRWGLLGEGLFEKCWGGHAMFGKLGVRRGAWNVGDSGVWDREVGQPRTDCIAEGLLLLLGQDTPSQTCGCWVQPLTFPQLLSSHLTSTVTTFHILLSKLYYSPLAFISLQHSVYFTDIK